MSDAAVKYVASLMRKNYESVGFLPEPKLEEYHRRGLLWLQRENDDPCGYLVFGAGYPKLRVYQCCIQTDARRRKNAAALIERLKDEADRLQCSVISLWCAGDLEANTFWPEMGFSRFGERVGGSKRGRVHVGWEWRAPDLFSMRSDVRRA